ncbi:hypothetical protein MRY87_02175 [bacterium]|nr:hypothetical protein [bacterium]
MRALPVIALLFWSLIALVLFPLEIYFPIPLSVVLLSGTAVYLFLSFRRREVGPLLLFVWCVYALPFIHIVPYLWFDFARESPVRMWGLMVRPYMLEEDIIQLTAMIGVVGAFAIVLGAVLGQRTKRLSPHLLASHRGKEHRVLPFLPWALWLAAGTAISWVIAPADNLFSAGYTSSESLLEANVFGSAWMLSYFLLCFCAADLTLDPHRERRRMKQVLFAVAVAYITIFLQLLRGDRAILPFLVGLVFLYFYWGKHNDGAKQPARNSTRGPHRIRSKFSFGKLVFLGLAIVSSSMLIGALRHSLIEVKDLHTFLLLLDELSGTGQIGLQNLLYGTWSAVLLTPLSVAGDSIMGSLPLKYGSTYVDYILSLPPGFVASFLGYERPINAYAGPAWEMTYGIGGTHAVAVPYMNFRMVGVLVIPFLWSFFLSRFEKVAVYQISVSHFAFLLCMTSAAPHSLWYGEKYFINAVIIYIFLRFLYKLTWHFSARMLGGSSRKRFVSDPSPPYPVAEFSQRPSQVSNSYLERI